ncbi:hypothetical protein DFO45_1763 [Azorhizobium sp. AG788]|uniref:hypothetical protein n=1 Tax=Azorhizobium sp. AG788 TaxID=2183897 RepID=UPI0010F3BFF1|nr:hypothetical protein [Azorhizobium sp. AG788]TDT96569.1 hypothetical protein DFO45_1763 [Azorhizobium sp. AG788]
MNRLFRHGLCLALAVGLALPAGMAPAAAQMAGPDLSAATGAVFLPFLNAPASGEAIARTPKLEIRFPGGRKRRAVMDTGSTGVVVSANLIPNLSQLPQLGPGSLTYSSSGQIEKGVWVQTPLTLRGADGTRVTTRPMPVLAVQEVACMPKARRCRPNPNPTHIAMVGVGFARQHDHQAQSTPDHNPLLSIEGMGTPSQPGAMRRGYVVSRAGVLVGLDVPSTQGFTFLKLEKSPTYPDWQAVPACLSVAGRTPPACGTMLMDTGVTTMYLKVPPEQLSGLTAPDAKDQPALVPGTSVSVSVTGAQGISYSFAAGDTANPVAPLNVVLVGRDTNPAPFVNTSVRFLNGFDYLYDADGGYVGFRPLK